MNVLGVIPARGGSKGIPRKALACLNGRPLIDYTIQAAKRAHSLARVVVSTDDPEIAEHARELGVEVPFLRPAELACDDTPILPVLRHLLDQLQATDDDLPDAVCLLQPTSPLRTAEHIDQAVGLLIQRGCDSVVSVVEVPHHCSPVSVMSCDEQGLLSPYLQGEGTRLTRRQDKPRVYARNGPAVLVTRTAVIREQGSLYGESTTGMMMPREASIDIDEPLDLVIAQALLSHACRDDSE